MIERAIVFAQWGLGLEAVKHLSSLYKLTVITSRIQGNEYGDAVFSWCDSNSIDVFDYKLDRDQINSLDLGGYSLLVSCSFGYKIPSQFYERMPNFNIHQSLLPEKRGPDPLANTIIGGDDVLGLTTHVLKEEFDVGAIYVQISWPLSTDSTMAGLYEECKSFVNYLISMTIKSIKDGVEPIEQDHSKATYAPKLNLDWNTSINDIRRTHNEK